MSNSVYLGIGSNSGDRRALIGRAVAALIDITEAEAMAVSPEYHSAPWGFSSPNEFLNIVVRLDFPPAYKWDEERALSLLDTLQELERSISSVPHRNADGSYRDREIDIDIIAVTGLTMNSARLTLPHPYASSRDFVIEPMRALASPEMIETLIGRCTL
ncbi:MAG: 2-amino-4-hydroxy-6-hydroxymethyldihydropteridine diphosphokinase [Muribaculaceae bacterium]|nr:2-amino-4-hydroxy-6-hydroxymethyldihydropteridine diphosphokinase [Muribaculaceae bacterium]